MRRGRALVFEIAVMAAIVLAVNAYRTRGAAGGMAPALPQATLNGPGPAIGAGRPVLIDFFATWCPICRIDQSAVAGAARHAPVIVVATQSPRRAVRSFAARHHWQVPVVLDPEGRIATRYGATVLPMAFILGPRGRVRAVVAGYTTTAGLLARLWLAGLHLTS